jgi:hypothetical protein
VADLVAEIERLARGRHVRWDGALWGRIVEGPARALATSLRSSGSDAASADALLESYLRLAAEGIGLGHVFPPEVGESFLGEAVFRLIPAGLAAVPKERRAQALADCWNLGENLEHSPAWWRRMFLRLLGDGASIGELGALVDRASREALGEPATRLGGRTLHLFVDLGAEDRRFLPGTLHFVAPTVVCVHDRRADEDEAPGRGSLGAWLVDPPVLLGAMGCAAEPVASSDRLDLVDELAKKDPRTADALNSAANEWRAAMTLETSQFLVAIYPA